MGKLSNHLIQKSDLLNTVVSIAIMFLVGSCMMMVLVVESNDDSRSLKPKKEINKNQSSNTSVVNNNQTPTSVNLLDSIK